MMNEFPCAAIVGYHENKHFSALMEKGGEVVMSNPYNTDGMLTYPQSDSGPLTTNAFQSIECAIAFDVRDWGADRRSAWIYAVVFGWDYGDAWDEVAEKYGWDDEDRKRAKKMHEQWEKAKEMKFDA